MPVFTDVVTVRWEPLVAKVLLIVKVSGNMFLQILCQLFSKESSLFLSRPLSSCAAALSVLVRQLYIYVSCRCYRLVAHPIIISHCVHDSVGQYIVENEGIFL